MNFSRYSLLSFCILEIPPNLRRFLPAFALDAYSLGSNLGDLSATFIAIGTSFSPKPAIRSISTTHYPHGYRSHTSHLSPSSSTFTFLKNPLFFSQPRIASSSANFYPSLVQQLVASELCVMFITAALLAFAT